MVHFTPLRVQSLLGALLVVLLLKASLALSAEDGRRAVEVARYGISVRVPQAWNLIDWGHDDKAFVLRLPQDAGSSVGFVACELGVAPESLEEYQKRQEASDALEQKKDHPARKLTENRIEPLDPKIFSKDASEKLGRLLMSVWENDREDGARWYEVRTRVIHDGTLYTFVLSTDEAHFAAYRLDFDEMLASSKFSPPETGLRRMPGGFWMQRDFRFALQLPAGWQPAFGPSDKVLFFATGAVHEVFTDNLLVLASPPQPLDLKQLRETLPGEIRKLDAQAQVPQCQIVPQGATAALETVIHTQRGEFEITILERRFRSQQRNYEVRFTCETSEYKKIEKALRQALDTFVEVAPDAPRRDA